MADIKEVQLMDAVKTQLATLSDFTSTDIVAYDIEGEGEWWANKDFPVAVIHWEFDFEPMENPSTDFEDMRLMIDVYYENLNFETQSKELLKLAKAVKDKLDYKGGPDLSVDNLLWIMCESIVPDVAELPIKDIKVGKATITFICRFHD